MLKLLCSSNNTDTFSSAVDDIKSYIQDYLGLELFDAVYEKTVVFQVLEDTNDSFSLGLVTSDGDTFSSISIYYIGNRTEGEFIYEDEDVMDVYVDDESVGEDCTANEAYNLFVNWFSSLRKRFNLMDEEGEYESFEKGISEGDLGPVLEGIYDEVEEKWGFSPPDKYRKILEKFESRYPNSIIDSEIQKMQEYLKAAVVENRLDYLHVFAPLASIKSSVTENSWNVELQFSGESYSIHAKLKEPDRYVAFDYVYSKYVYHHGENPSFVSSSAVLTKEDDNTIDDVADWYKSLSEPLLEEAFNLIPKDHLCQWVHVNSEDSSAGIIALSARFYVTKEDFGIMYNKGKNNEPRSAFKYRKRKVDIKKNTLTVWDNIINDIKLLANFFNLSFVDSKMDVELYPYKKINNQYDAVTVSISCKKK